MQLGLGTVQFGLHYGISNKTGMVSLPAVKSILEIAYKNGIRILDTASAYGESEQALGRAISGGKSFRIITKLPGLKKEVITSEDIKFLLKTFEESMERLCVDTLEGLLLHAPGDLFIEGGESLFDLLSSLKERGLVNKIGASVYTGEEIDRLLSRHEFDIIQLPLNVLDQRLVKSGHLTKLKERKIEIHARSVFLQGLLVMPPEEIHPYFKSISAHLHTYRNFLNEHDLSATEGALSFLHGIDSPDVVLIGVENEKQLHDNINAFARASQYKNLDFSCFAVDDGAMVNPQFWKLG